MGAAARFAPFCRALAGCRKRCAERCAPAVELGIEYLTLYSFSSENWSRPASEVDYLLNLLRRFIHHDVAELHSNGVKIKVIGDRGRLGP